MVRALIDNEHMRFFPQSSANYPASEKMHGREVAEFEQSLQASVLFFYFLEPVELQGEQEVVLA